MLCTITSAALSMPGLILTIPTQLPDLSFFKIVSSEICGILREEKELTDSIQGDICQILKRNASPRHVPAKIIKVTDIPRTRSGKITEIVVKDLIHKRPISNKEAISNPEIIEEFKSKAELLNIP